MKKINLSLVSHTNVGKTTLMRTLLRKDVGVIGQNTHITTKAESHIMRAAGDTELVLWDAPGFGATPLLMEQLGKDGANIQGFLNEGFSLKEKAFYCSQQAIRNALNNADLLLYLVDVSQDPFEESFVEAELELMGWIGKPVMIVLNQISDENPTQASSDWSARCAKNPVVKGRPILLDGHDRCWTQEYSLLTEAKKRLPESLGPGMDSIIEDWKKENLKVFARSTESMAQFLWAAARMEITMTKTTIEKIWKALKQAAKQTGIELHKVIMTGAPFMIILMKIAQSAKEAKKILVKEVGKDIETQIGAPLQEMTIQMIQDHQLAGNAEAKMSSEARPDIGIDLFESAGVNALLGATAGAAITLALEIITGGFLTIILALIGWLIGWKRKPKKLRLKSKQLTALTEQVIRIYLGIAHFGRGQGRVTELTLNEPSLSQKHAEEAINSRKEELSEVVSMLMEGEQDATQKMQEWLSETLRETLINAHPKAKEFLT